jgi:hypothetical protein
VESEILYEMDHKFTLRTYPRKSALAVVTESLSLTPNQPRLLLGLPLRDLLTKGVPPAPATRMLLATRENPAADRSAAIHPKTPEEQ